MKFKLLPYVCCGIRQPEVDTTSALATPLDDKTMGRSNSTESGPPLPVRDNENAPIVQLSRQTVTNTVKTALNLLHITLDAVPIPGLKGLIGGIIFIMDTFDKADQAQDVFADLERNVVSLEILLSRYRDPSQDIPTDIKDLVVAVTDELEEVNAQIQEVISRHLVRRIVNGSADGLLVVKLVRKIDWALARMLTGISLNSANSFQRLEENGQRAFLDKIVRAKDASWRHLERPVCLPGTRVSLLGDIVKWFTSTESLPVFWLSGLAGTGKTTIAQTVAELAARHGKLGASFFCSRDSSERSDHNLIFPTIAFQLAESDARLAFNISNAVKNHLDISSMRPEEQLKTLILGPLKEQSPASVPLLTVVDALDECRDSGAAEKILLALSRNGAFSLPFFKIFLTSRPVSSARAAFKDSSLSPLSRIYDLHETTSQDVNQDLRLFITNRLQEGAQQFDRYSVPPDWPPSSLVDKLVHKSSSFFIFASTACQYITAIGGDLEERLEEIANLRTSNYERDFGIDALYKRVFDTAFERFPDARTIIRCRSIVGTIILLQNPVPIPDLAKLLDFRLAAIRSILNELRSLLIVPDDIDDPVRPFHASLHDFLTDRQRCPENLYIDPSFQHQRIAISLLKCMNSGLKRNICQINSFTLNRDVEDLAERIVNYIGRDLDYACRHWSFHLKSTMLIGEDSGKLVELLCIFAKEKMFNWLEALSLLGELPSAVSALDDASTWCLAGGQQTRELAELFRDGRRAVLHLAQGISECASQIYHAVPFLPTKTPIRSVYQHEDDMSIKVMIGMEEAWNTCLRTIDNDGPVSHVAFSRDGETIATSGLHQSLSIVRLWDAKTGELVTQSGPWGDTWPCFAFLPNGWLVIGLSDGTLRVRDNDASQFTHPLRAHTNSVQSIAISATGSHVVSGSEDAVYVWDTSTWEPEELPDARSFVAVSCRGLVGATIIPPDDKTVIGIWDLRTREPKKKMIGHTDEVMSLGFSPDGRKLVSGGADGSVRIWDVATGKQKIKLGGLPGWALSVAFSPDGVHVAGSDNAVRVWDTSTWELKFLLKGHQAQINSLSFSPNGKLLATGSSDNTVKIWDWQNALNGEEEEGHTEWIQTVAISPDGKTFVTASWDSTIAMWDSSDGRLIKLWKGHERSVLSVMFSPDGRFFASAGGEMIVKFWNSVTGELERALFCHPDHNGSSENSQEEESTYPSAWSGALAFSADGTKLAFETEYNMTMWDLSTGVYRTIWAGNSTPYIYSLAFSSDERRIVSGREDGIYEIDLDKPKTSNEGFSQFETDGVARQIAYGYGDASIVSTAGVVKLREISESKTEPRLGCPHLSRGWLVDSEGNKRCWVPEAYRGSDVHASHGLTRIVLGGTNGRPLIVDMTAHPQVQA